MKDFSYKFYIELINSLRNTLPLKDFKDITESDTSFLLLRHDVEFSIEKAYELARIEHELLNIQSSYFFQTRNYSYNPFSFKNMALINKIHEMGHKIGLHVNTSGLKDLSQIEHFIQNDVTLLSQGLNLPIDRFSFHRPIFALLKADIKIDGLINTYAKPYFQLYEHTPPKQLNIHYYSDSEHRWKYGSPLEGLKKQARKIQLLTHPYSWSKEGLDNFTNFKELSRLKYYQMLRAMQSECHNFPDELLK